MSVPLAGRVLTDTKSSMGKNQRRMADHLCLLLACIMLASLLLCGCSHLGEGGKARAAFKEANDFFSQGNYAASLGKYQQIIEQYPEAEDRALFEMALIYAHPGNGQSDYQKALESFQNLIRDYPESPYRKDSELMLFTIDNVIGKDRTIAAQQTIIEALQQEIKGRGAEISALQKTIEACELEVRSRENTISALQKLPSRKARQTGY